MKELMPFLMKHPIGVRTKGDTEQFSLTDVWRICGSDENRRPKDFFRTQRAQQLIELLELQKGGNSPLFEIERGRNKDTWAIKELVIAFAMWISADVHLYVIQCFEEYQEAKRSRQNIKGLHKAVTAALKDSRAQQGKDTKWFHYSNEAHMINSTLVGMNYKEWLQLNELEDAGFRNALNPEQLARLEELEQYDAFLIEEGVEYDKRKEKLEAKNKRIIQRKIEQAKAKEGK